MSCINKRIPLKRRRANGREPSNYPTDGVGIPMRITRLFPMKLKDVTVESLSEKQTMKSDVVCIQEMMTLFDCFEKHDFERGPCQSSILALENCYSGFRSQKRAFAASRKT